MGRDTADSDDASRAASLTRAQQLGGAGCRSQHEIIGEHENEGLVFQQGLRSLDRVCNPHRLGLLDELEVSELFRRLSLCQEILIAP